MSILDSDDFYSPNVFKLINDAGNADIICGNFKPYNGFKQKSTKKVFYKNNKIITNKHSMKSPYCLLLPYFFKKEIFMSINNLIEGISYQDGVLNSQIINLANTLIHIKNVIGNYYYNREGNSMGQNWSDARCEILYATCLEYLKYENQEGVLFRLLANGKFRKYLKTNKKYFYIKRKFYFKWFVIFDLLFLLTTKTIMRNFFVYS